MNTPFNRIHRSMELQAANGLGDILSDDTTARGVELAFVERYVKAAAKASKRAFLLAQLEGLQRVAASSGAQPKVEDDLEAQVVANLALMRSPAFAKIARQLEKNLPADATFGKFRGKSVLDKTGIE